MASTRKTPWLAVVLGAATGCSYPLDDFQAPEDSGKVDSAIDAPGDTKPDSTVADAPADSKLDTMVVDTGVTDAAEETDVVDTGPPDVVNPCTTVVPTGYGEMICIEDGVAGFELGAEASVICPTAGCAVELPRVNVKVTKFFVDAHEVTVGRFRTWWNATTRTWPSSSTTFFNSSTKDLKWKGTWPTAPTAPATSAGCTWISPTDPSHDDKPLNCVDWFTALAFCMADGPTYPAKRLPTEAEWELAATSGGNRLFPWSAPGTESNPINEAELDCAHTLHGGSCTPLNASPTSTIWGRTTRGIWNMAGSLSEWVLDAPLANWSSVVAGTLDPFTDPGTGTSRLARGGSWISPSRDLRASGRPVTGADMLQTKTTAADSQIGFRCVKR